jgi:hypothetical protein
LPSTVNKEQVGVSLILAQRDVLATVSDGQKKDKNTPRIELVMQLPPEWPLNSDLVKDPQNNWPIAWLRTLASYLNNQIERVDHYFVVSNQQLPALSVNGAQFMAVFVIDNSSEYGQVITNEKQRIVFYDVCPLHEEEFNLYETKGINALTDHLDANDIGNIVDIYHK